MIPVLGCDDMVWPAVAVLPFDVGLHSHAVKVLVQAIEQEREKLRRIMLCPAFKLRRVLDNALMKLENNSFE